MGILAFPLAVLIGGYLLVLVLVAVFQRRLIYLPVRSSEKDLLTLAETSGCRPWRDEQGEVIAWRSKTPRTGARARILVFNGNAGYALHLVHLIEALEQVGAGQSWEVILLEYPGYGARSGRPGESAFRAAGIDAVNRLGKEDSRPVFLLGISIGTGPACALASDLDSIAGLMLITPFSRLEDVAAARYPWLPVRRFLRDRYDNIDALANYAGPVALLLAGQDETTPARLGRELHRSLQTPSLLREQADRQHNTLDLSPTASWWDEASRFLLDEPRN